MSGLRSVSWAPRMVPGWWTGLEKTVFYRIMDVVSLGQDLGPWGWI